MSYFYSNNYFVLFLYLRRKWCGDDFEGVIVFDEGHAAKNLQPGKSSSSSLTGQRVFDLQEQLPKARIVYVSATGATEPHRMYFVF